MNAETVHFTREALYRLVWSEPMHRLARRYAAQPGAPTTPDGLPSTAEPSTAGPAPGADARGDTLSAVCRRLQIPVPGPSYWRRRALGHPVVQERLRPLPPSAPADARAVTLLVRRAASSASAVSAGEQGVASTPAPAVASPTGTPPAAAPAAGAHAAPRAPVGVDARASEAPDVSAPTAAAGRATAPVAASPPARRIVVASTLEAAAPLHPLVRQTRDALRDAPAWDRGLLQPLVRDGPVPWGPREEMSRYERLRAGRPTAALHVTVTPAAVDRALRILDALCKALDTRGYPVSCTLRTGRPAHRSGYIAAHHGDSGNGSVPGHRRLMTRVAVGDEDVFLLLREVVSKVPRPSAPPPPVPGRPRRDAAPTPAPAPTSPEYDHVGSGRFILTMPHTPGNYTAHWVWDESKKRQGPLEEGLDEVVAAVVAAADDFRAWREAARAREREAEERARLAHQEQQRRATEETRLQRLEAEAAAWARANHIRAYVAAVRAAAEATDEPLPDALAEWLTWASARADRLDPVPQLVARLAPPAAPAAPLTESASRVR